MTRAGLLILGLLASLTAFAGGAAPDAGTLKLKGQMKIEVPKFDLGVPKFGAVPKGEDLKRVDDPATVDRPTGSTLGPEYEVVRVVNAKALLHTPEGAKASAPFNAVAAAGNPLILERFSTVVRVKSAKRRSASIELQVLDLRDDTVMESSGALVFRGGDEAEWQVDWDPTVLRRVGDLRIVVQVGGQAAGTFPLKVEAKGDEKATPKVDEKAAPKVDEKPAPKEQP